MTSQPKRGDYRHGQSSQPRNETVGASSNDNTRLQGRLFHLSQLVSRQLTPLTTGSAVAQELREISQTYNEQLTNLQKERANLGHRLQDKQRLLENAVYERDIAYQERDVIQARYDELVRQNRIKEKALAKRVAEVEKNLNEDIETLQSEIKFRDDQIQGKRSLWVEKQKSTGSKRASDTRDPFSTPTNNGQAWGLSAGENKPNPSKNLADKLKALQTVPGTLRPSEIETVSGSSKSTQYPTSLPTGQAFPSQEQWEGEARLEGTARNPIGGPTDQSSQALIPFKTMDQLATEFSEMISRLYGLIEGWSHIYGNNVNPLDADQRVAMDEEKWKLMIDCASAEKQEKSDAEQHLVYLLRDNSTRAWLIFRVIVQYIDRDIWTGLAFTGFNQDCDQKLKYAATRLRGKGLTVSERASLISTRTSIISYIVESGRYLSFRSAALAKHTKNLRALLGPLLNVGASRADAGRDLGMIVVHAFDISTKIFTSSYSFVIIFPKCGDKFQYASMICRDSSHCIDPLTLQIKQYRLKLVITPTITLRDDRQRTIKVASVQYANVLVMV